MSENELAPFSANLAVLKKIKGGQLNATNIAACSVRCKQNKRKSVTGP